jgi:hypothetical protein
MTLGEQHESLRTPLEEQWQQESTAAVQRFFKVFGDARATAGHVDLLNGGIDLTYEPGEEVHLPTFLESNEPGTIEDTRALVVAHKYTDVVGMLDNGRLDERPKLTKYVLYVRDMSETRPDGQNPQRWSPYSVAVETYDISEDAQIAKELPLRQAQQKYGEGLEHRDYEVLAHEALAKRVVQLRNRKAQLALQRSNDRPAAEPSITADSLETVQRLHDLLDEAAAKIPTQSARAIVASENSEDY